MKTLFTIIFSLTVLFASTKSQTVVSSCTASDSIKALYKDDADLLALKRIFELKVQDTAYISINSVYSDPIMEALMAVYNASSLPARDTVVELFAIHTWPSPSKSIYVDVMDTITTIHNLLYNNYPTGDPILDSLLSPYKLTVTNVIIGWLPNSFIAELTSSTMLNMYALIDSISLVEGVNLAYVNAPIGDGADIEYSELITGNGTFRNLIYSYGWGDCQAGCIYRRYWSFLVSLDCSVEFIESYGDVLDSSTSKIDLGYKPSMFVNIFPNPIQDQLILELNGRSDKFEIRVLDMLGNTVLINRITINDQVKVEFNMSDLPSGAYILSVESATQSKRQVIVKQ